MINIPGSVWTSVTRSRCAALLLGLFGVATGCKDTTLPPSPTRVLDRPMDLALACVRVECPEEGDCVVHSLPIAECGDGGLSCRDYATRPGGLGDAQLIGFVANSERNEVALFRRCDGRLIDMDPATPGYNFIPVGELPSRVVRSDDSCRVITSNRGVHSCDLSVIDVPGVARHVFQVPGAAEAPSGLVKRVQPLRYASAIADPRWVPLGARPGEIIPTPTVLSQSTPIDGGGGLLDACSPEDPGSVYVTFPGCDLVAEIDLVTQQILQSVQFSRTKDGISWEDTGASPVCPVDCPGVFEASLPPSDVPSGDALGLKIEALELVVPVDGSADTGRADSAIVDNTLFVGGLGTDFIAEIPVDDDGQWNLEDIDSHALQLFGANGVERIRATPAMTLTNEGFSDVYQFLYLVAGDGSTRVVRRNLDPGSGALGEECDTQIDPRALPFAPDAHVCAPVAESEGREPMERRAFVRGPGIRTRDGSRITDWLFKKQPAADHQIEGGVFGDAGAVLGVGVTSAGGVVTSAFGQFPQENHLSNGRDPARLLDIGIRAHMLHPADLPTSGVPGALPTMANQRSRRSFPSEIGPTRALSPALRLIDFAYASVSEEADSSVTTTSDLLGNITNADAMGRIDTDGSGVNGYYSEPVVRAVAPDYRAWVKGEWALEWEGQIPGTTSSSGQIRCASPGWRDATCRPVEPNDSRLVDDTASFCTDGVLAGDKLVLAGCTIEEGCGPGQQCLLDPAARSTTGICVSAQAYETHAAELRETCSEFIRDPCGPVRREFLITRAFQEELWLQALDIDPMSFLERPKEEMGEAGVPPDEEGESADDAGSEGKVADVVEAEASMLCLELQPDGGCKTHDDCSALDDADAEDALCLEGMCRRPCAGDECMLRRLPGRACFAELVRYRVQARHSFLVRGPGSSNFIHDRVVVGDDGECRLVDDDAPVSSLLTSRIRLGPNDANLGLPACDDDMTPSAAPNPCRIPWPRPSGGESKSHYMSYQPSAKGDAARYPVTAVRYTNPSIQLTLDLVDLKSLIRPVVDDGGHWPHDFRVYRRSRIPRGYRETFATDSGYRHVNGRVPTGDGLQALTFPVRIIHGSGKDPSVIYIVDSSGPGSGSQIRGQVIRAEITRWKLEPDFGFDRVR
ncbi:MAG: hypothetical protein V3V08_12010 [Nannocystaceae bacterium]